MSVYRPSKAVLCLAAIISMLAFALPVFADGGAVLAREVAGPFLVTVFTAPATPRARLVDVSVLVQSNDTGETILDADVELRIVSPPGVEVAGREMFCTPDGTQIRAVGTSNNEPRAIPATQKRATNKLLYAAKVNLPAAGDWQMRVRVRRGEAMAEVNCTLSVAASSAGQGIAWPFIVAPLFLIGMFVCHQCLQKRALPAWRVIPNPGGSPP